MCYATLIDVAPAAIARTRAKASERGLTARLKSLTHSASAASAALSTHDR